MLGFYETVTIHKRMRKIAIEDFDKKPGRFDQKKNIKRLYTRRITLF
jgi:hypothetical protein